MTAHCPNCGFRFELEPDEIRELVAANRELAARVLGKDSAGETARARFAFQPEIVLGEGGEPIVRISPVQPKPKGS